MSSLQDQAPPDATASHAPEASQAGALAQRIQSALNMAGRELLRDGAVERHKQLNAELARPRTSKPVVVLAGEAKTGKSSLLNALLGRTGVSPVDADIATGARIVFQHAGQDAAAVHLIDSAGMTPIPFEQIGEWATVSGNPGNEKNVKSVAVALSAPILAGMTVIDTPGVGGLDAGHGQAALESLRHADALLFISNAGSHLTGPELRFLTAAAERIDTIILVLTRSDLAKDVEAVKAKNVELLTHHASRFSDAPMIAVSNVKAERAMTATDERKAERWLSQSGIPTLQELLTVRVTRRAGVLRLSNAIRFAHSSLVELERRWSEQAAAATGEPTVGAALQREQERLAELQRDKATWSTRLEDELTQLGFDRANQLMVGISALRNRYEERSKEASQEDLAAFPGQVLQDVEALANRLAAQSTERIARLVEDLGAELDPNSSLAETLNELAQIKLDDNTQLTAPTTKRSSELDHLTTMISFSSGHSIAQFALTAGIFGIVGAPLAIAGAAVGAGFAWRMKTGRQLVALQADFRSWLQQQLPLAQNLITNEFNRRTNKLRTDLRNAANTHLKRRENEVASALKTHEQAQQSDRAARQRLLAAAEQRLADVRRAIEEMDWALTELRELS